MNKVYCNECKKDITPSKGKCPNCGLEFNDDLLKNENVYSLETNIVSLILKVIIGILFLLGIPLTISSIGNIWFLILIILFCLLMLALSELIQICHDIRAKLYKKNK